MDDEQACPEPNEPQEAATTDQAKPNLEAYAVRYTRFEGISTASTPESAQEETGSDQGEAEPGTKPAPQQQPADTVDVKKVCF